MVERPAGDGLLSWLVGGVLVGVVVLGLVVAAYAVGYRRGEDAAQPEAMQTQPASTQPAATTAGETTAPAETTAPSGGDATAGKAVFASAGCGSCHTLADAGTTGTVGPNLDELKPTAAQVKTIVGSGRDGMPSFGDLLAEGDIEDVAAYVSSVAGA